MKQFDFGKNWIAFSRNTFSRTSFINARIDFISLANDISLRGKRFLDIGFGQGVALLIAEEEGAEVTGCDINSRCRESLAINAATLEKAPPESVIIGSILEESTVDTLRSIQPEGFDIVHSWGVLHHTGNMRRAIRNAASLVMPDGHLILALYNRHWSSPFWTVVKYLYVHSPRMIQTLLTAVFFPVIFLAKFAVTRSNPFTQQRGMNFFYDVIDWIGGYPYEYASVEEVKGIVEPLGFTCRKVVPAQVPTGCNEFVFENSSEP